jgi:hypothetical protein
MQMTGEIIQAGVLGGLSIELADGRVSCCTFSLTVLSYLSCLTGDPLWRGFLGFV